MKLTEAQRETCSACREAIEECAHRTVSGQRNSELLKLFLALYAVRCGAHLRYVDGRLAGVDSGDSLCTRLYQALSAIMGPDYSFGDIEGLYVRLKEVPVDTYRAIYPSLMDKALMYARDTRYYSTACPPRYFSRTIDGALQRTGCRTVSNPRAGFGALTWAFPPGVECRLEERSPLLALLGEVATDALGNGTSSFGSWPEGVLPDAAVSVLPINYSFDQVEWWEQSKKVNIKVQKQFLEDALAGRLATRMVAAVLHFDACNNYICQEARKALFEEGRVETVVTFPCSSGYNILPDAANVVTSLVILDFTRRHDTVRFIAAESIIAENPQYRFSVFSTDYDFVEINDGRTFAVVPLSDIRDTAYAFNAYLHVQNVPLQDGGRLVRLADVADLVLPDGPYRSLKGLTVGREELSYEVAAACRQVPLKKGRVIDGHEISGETVLFTLDEDWKVSAGINRGKRPFLVEDTVHVLRPKRNVILPEYLVYVLLNDRSLKEYMGHICEHYLNGFRTSHLMNRLIPLCGDLEEQRRCVEIFMQDTPAELVYDALLLSSRPEEDLAGELSSSGIRVSRTVGTVSELEALLSEVASRRDIGASFDVLFADPLCRCGEGDEEPYEGLDCLIDLKERCGAPVYLISGVDAATLIRESGIRRRRLSYFLDGGRFFRRGETGALAAAVRTELKASAGEEALIRNRFAAFFEAAAWYDRTYGKEVSATISSYLSGKAGARPFNDVRSLTEGVIRILQEVDAVPKGLDPGAVPKFINERRYENKKEGGKVYYLLVDLMPRYLSSALVTVYDAGRSGSHDIVEDTNMGMAVVNAFMSFLEWFYANRERFASRVTGYYDAENPNEKEYIFEGAYEGVVRCEIIEGRPYYYCGEFHLQVDERNPGVSEGDTIVITRARRERRPRKEGVSKYADRNGYEKKLGSVQ